MKLIKNAKEFKRIYPYKSPPNPEPCPKKDEYPTRYPCFCEVMSEDGGLMGDYMWVEIIYPPKGCNLKSFLAGLKAGRGRD